MAGMKTLFAAALVAIWLSPAAVLAKFPEREVSAVVPWDPGGRTDTATRLWTPALAKELGVPVVVENRPGGGGIIGARHVLTKTDGYTAGVFSITHVISQWTRVPVFELDKYIPVALPFNSPFVLAIKADAPYKDLNGFVAATRRDPLKVGNSGTGTSGHIAAAAFAEAAKAGVRHIPYKGDAGAVAALMSGEVDAVMTTMVAIAQQVASGQVKAVGVSADKRDDLHKGVPTFKEQGVNFVLGDFGGGVYLPKGTPKEVVARWEEALARTFANDEVRKKMRDFFIEIDYKNGSQFRAILEEWNPKLEALVDKLGLRPKQ